MARSRRLLSASAGADEAATGVAQLTCALVQLLHLSRQLDREPRVAKGQSRLVGQVGEQLVLAAAQRMPGRHRHHDAAEAFTEVQHRYIEPGVLRVARSVGRPRRRLIGACIHAQHDHDADRIDGSGGSLGDRWEQRGRVGAAAESPSEVGECLVRCGRGAERQPVGHPDDPAAQGLEGQGDHRGREE